MEIQANVLKAYLKNVLFVTGTPCGGKTTISRELSRRHGLAVYDVDEQFPVHQRMSDPLFQPAMNQTFRDADAFFGRSVEEYTRWLLDNTREQLDFILLDLIRFSRDRVVLCDLHLTVEQTDAITDRDRVVFLIRDPADLVEEYCNRPDHDGFCRFINSATDPEQARRTCGQTLERLNRKRYEEIRQSSYFWLERTAQSTVADTLAQVEKHFGLTEQRIAE